MGRKKIEQIANEVVEETKKPIEKKKIDESNLIPTGSTLFNLALSNNPFGGYALGKFSNLIGDSHAGKSFLALTMLTECCFQKRFDEFDLIYDDSGAANEFDVEYLFGQDSYNRIIWDIMSDTTEDFYGNLYGKIRNGKPFIYVLDDFDSIASEEDKARANEFADRKKISGTYGTAKPRLASEIFRTVKSDLKKIESFLLIISQTRDNIGFGAQFKPKTRAGGKALKFYSTHETWLAVKGHPDKKNNRIVTTLTEAKTTKNKLTGNSRTIDILFLNNFGIDDISTNIDFLVDEEFWKKNKQTIIAPEFELEGTKRKLIYEIENKNLERELQTLVGEVWNNIEIELMPTDRKRKY